MIWRAQIGYGVNWEMLSLLLQEVLLSVTKSNPERVTGLEDANQLPNLSHVSRFAERHGFVLRASMGISKGHQIVSEEELRLWQDDTWKFFSSNPELLEALQDKSRVFNLDETSIELGINKKKVLTQRVTKVLFNVSLSSCDHITTMLTINEAGHIGSP